MESYFNCWYNAFMNNKENKKTSQLFVWRQIEKQPQASGHFFNFVNFEFF